MRKASIIITITVLVVLMVSCSQADETDGIESVAPPISSFSAGETEETTLPNEEPTAAPESEPSQSTESKPHVNTPATDSTLTPTQKPQSKSDPGVSQQAQSQPPAETSKASTPSQPPATSAPTQPPVTSEPTQPAFDINYWIQFAKDYGQSIGLIYDEGTTGSWDTPLAAGPTLKYTERDIKDRLNRYKNKEGVVYFSVWAESRQDGSGKYDIYIGYA